MTGHGVVVGSALALPKSFQRVAPLGRRHELAPGFVASPPGLSQVADRLQATFLQQQGIKPPMLDFGRAWGRGQLPAVSFLRGVNLCFSRPYSPDCFFYGSVRPCTLALGGLLRVLAQRKDNL